MPAGRHCLRPPVAAIFEAAHLLDRAVGMHEAGRRDEAAALLAAADMREVRQWTESLWGPASGHPGQARHLAIRRVPDAPPRLGASERVAARMPTASEKRALIAHWGHGCAFCGIPLIRAEVRARFVAAYPGAVPWGRSNESQHAAFQCLWLQYDHVLPHARGGGNGMDNLVVTCAGCNYGRGDRTLDEQALTDPRARPAARTSWDGLERFRP